MTSSKAAEAKLDSLTSRGKEVLAPYSGKLVPLSRKGGLRVIGAAVSTILEVVNAKTKAEEERYDTLVTARANAPEDNVRWLDTVAAHLLVSNYVKDFLSAYIAWTGTEEDDEE